jgi:hypothetical protein
MSGGKAFFAATLVALLATGCDAGPEEETGAWDADGDEAQDPGRRDASELRAVDDVRPEVRRLPTARALRETRFAVADTPLAASALDTGASDTGGTATGASSTSASTTGGTDTGASGTSASTTGGTATGASDTGGTDTGASDTSASTTGGTNTSGSSPGAAENGVAVDHDEAPADGASASDDAPTCSEGADVDAPIATARVVTIPADETGMEPISPGDCVEVVDDCDADPLVELTWVASDEPADGVAVDDRSPDVTDLGCGLGVRAERATSGDGRVYTVGFRATDRSGNATEGTCTILVEAESGVAPVDSGAVYEASLIGLGCP